MRKFLYTSIFTIISTFSVLSAQTVQAGIFMPDMGSVQVRAKASEDINSTSTNIVITVLYPASDNLVFGSVQSPFSMVESQSGTVVIGSVNYKYSTYASVANVPLNLASGTEFSIMTLPIQSGSSTFSLAENGQVSMGDWYFECTDAPYNLTASNAFYQASATEPLPVELSSFSASVAEDRVILNWKTATELNNLGFDVERSASPEPDAKWEKIGFVKGAGNTDSWKSYSYTDAKISGGKVSYRLKQVDFDGKSKYSSVASVSVLPGKYELYQNYPNPFNPSTNIKFSLTKASRVVLTVYNILGERVKELVNQNMEEGFHEMKFDGSALASGTYIVKLEAGSDFQKVKKMLLMK